MTWKTTWMDKNGGTRTYWTRWKDDNTIEVVVKSAGSKINYKQMHNRTPYQHVKKLVRMPSTTVLLDGEPMTKEDFFKMLKQNYKK
ncbi:hypothetical protein LCGC14_0249920 [marine sediment metagenome]|uniref:Uncharacterized protein n=1 Tax=marine sediment metagenome TaxID=412755 RepID=A0A0F9U9X3_9ZZZZ